MSLWDKNTLELHEELLTNIYIDNLEQGMDLISKLLEENNKQSELSAEFDRFSQLIRNDFLIIANKMAHPQNASIYHELISFNKRLEEFVMFPEISFKKIVAVGGGFSAGKSKLINLIIGEDLLPTDTTPTTSIPSYIISGNETLFYAHNIYGLKSELDEEAIKAITHSFSKKYNISLSQVMKNILLKSQSMKYKNLAILDTPGYSKSDHHKKELNKDEHIARAHLHSSDCLIWVVDIEKGTIPNQDFEFIKSMDIKCPIFFVFNKADKKELSDIKTIIEVAKKNVSNQGIQCAGVGAVSALLKKEYGDDQLRNYLLHENEQKSVVNIKKEFQAILNKYEQHTAQNILALQKELKQLNEVALASSLKHEQDLLRPLIADRKKKITTEREKVKQLQISLTPFITALEKIQELLTNQLNEKKHNIIHYKQKQFLHQLLKINIKEIIQEKVTMFVNEIELEKAEKDQIFSASKIKCFFEETLSLLQKDIIIKIEKEMFHCYEDIENQIAEMTATELEKQETYNVLSDTLNAISHKLKHFNFEMENEKKLTNILYKYNTFSSHFEELLKEILNHESIIWGNYTKKEFHSFYQDTIIAMLNQKWGQE